MFLANPAGFEPAAFGFEDRASSVDVRVRGSPGADGGDSNPQPSARHAAARPLSYARLGDALDDLLVPRDRSLRSVSWRSRRDSNPRCLAENQETSPASRRDRVELVLVFFWSGRRDSNPHPGAWKAWTLPLSYARMVFVRLGSPRSVIAGRFLVEPVGVEPTLFGVRHRCLSVGPRPHGDVGGIRTHVLLVESQVTSAPGPRHHVDRSFPMLSSRLESWFAFWSGRRGSNPHAAAWVAGALPLSYARLFW